MSLITLQNVSKPYESGLVLRDIYFRLASGDRIGLLGSFHNLLRGSFKVDVNP